MSNPAKFHRNLLIVANAGSGKTHALVTRCIQLLHRGAEPEKILALTFTRAAAAEFLRKIFERLADAAADPEKLEALRKELPGDGSFGRGECHALLRRMVNALPRLAMGTIDQHFGRIVRAFPFELGLSREAELLNEADEEDSRHRALDRLFAEAGRSGALRSFIELIRQQSRARADQSALRVLDAATSDLQQKFLETPEDRPWGDPDAIWPDGSEILSAGDVEPLTDGFLSELHATNPDLGEGATMRLGEWLEQARAHRPPARMAKDLADFVRKKLDEVKEDRDGAAYFPVGNGKANRVYLRGRLPDARSRLRMALLKREMESRLRSSRALYGMLEAYERVYQESVRSSGALTFQDLVVLLAAHQGKLSHRHIEYRLDARHDHWLLDEFQDTSRLQWRVLDPLAEEIVWDSEERRTFFCVGDTKQAIYGWRGGDCELFWDVLAKYNAGREVIATGPLGVSYRSDRNIVDVVNAVLDPACLENPEAMEEFRLPRKTVQDWKKAWVPHVARKNAADGFAQFKVVEAPDGGEQQAALDREVLRILREADPVGRGLECAILVRKRETLGHYVALLESHAVPVAAEGRINPCLASAPGRALLALSKFTASPGDEIARGHFMASPFAVLAGGDAERFRFRVLRSAAARGFAHTFLELAREMEAQIDPAEVMAFIEAAADYDEVRRPGDDWRRFIGFIEKRVAQESGSPGVVRVMTVHGAKGLGFDMVILPELGGKGMTDFHDDPGIAIHRDAQGNVLWGMSLPPKDVCAADTVLKDAREEMRARQAYEAFCVLYVAMTRPKHALYCLRAEGRSNMKNAGRWLHDHFPEPADGNETVRTLGDERWFEAFSHPQEEQPRIRGTALRVSSDAAMETPSGRGGEDVPAAALLSSAPARRLGTAVHALLARVEWLDEDEPDFSGADAEVVRVVREFLSGERAREILSRPPGHVLIWRERAFDAVLDGRLHGGVFDRVHVVLSEDGTPVSAVVYDFKTDRDVDGIGERHARQLAIYRRAAAALLGLPEGKVECSAVPVRA